MTSKKNSVPKAYFDHAGGLETVWFDDENETIMGDSLIENHKGNEYIPVLIEHNIPSRDGIICLLAILNKYFDSKNMSNIPAENVKAFLEQYLKNYYGNSQV